ncbi:kinase-like domain-containing protein [Flammula alnicola]|nr:kinase-like domain-containing protein [Flammula alnicola]
MIEGLLYTLFSPLLLCRFGELAVSSRKIDANTYYDELGKLNIGQVAKIAPDAVAKDTIRLVLSPLGSLLVLEYIPGRTVHDLWPTLGWWQRFRILLTLRYYIYQLRLMRTRAGGPTFPGPPSGENVPQRCTGRLFTSEGSGPFQSYREMARWYQNRLLVMQKYRKEGLQCSPFDDTGPLVFTHMDLHPRNFIMGDDGQLWVIDWEDAGWYPPWFEAASMQLFVKTHPDAPSSWANWIPFIAGSCEAPGQLPFIRAIAYSLEVLCADIMNLIDMQETS